MYDVRAPPVSGAFALFHCFRKGKGQYTRYGVLPSLFFFHSKEERLVL